VRNNFVDKIYPQIVKNDDLYVNLPTDYDHRFMALWRKWEAETKKQAGPKQIRRFEDTKKGQAF
jgi:hypothetical protein